MSSPARRHNSQGRPPPGRPPRSRRCWAAAVDFRPLPPRWPRPHRSNIRPRATNHRAGSTPGADLRANSRVVEASHLPLYLATTPTPNSFTWDDCPQLPGASTHLRNPSGLSQPSPPKRVARCLFRARLLGLLSGKLLEFPRKRPMPASNFLLWCILCVRLPLRIGTNSLKFDVEIVPPLPQTPGAILDRADHQAK